MNRGNSNNLLINTTYYLSGAIFKAEMRSTLLTTKIKFLVRREAGYLVMWPRKVRASRFESCPSHLSTLPSDFWSADNAHGTPSSVQMDFPLLFDGVVRARARIRQGET